MKRLVNKRLCVFALTLGLAASFCYGNVAFGGNGAAIRIFKTFANGSYISTTGGAYTFTGSVGASLGTDVMYMRRGQEPANETTQQINDILNSEPSTNNAKVVPSNNLTFMATPYHATYVGRTNYNDEITPQIHGGSNFVMRRTGFLASVQKECSSDFFGSWIIGYSKVDMTQNADIMPDNPYEVADYTGGAKLSLADFQFGGKLKCRLSDGFFLVATVVGGAEDYRWDRRMYQSHVSGKNPLEGLYSFGTTGNTLVGDLTLIKSYELGGGWALAPSVSFESSNSWIFEASETGQGYGGADSAASEAWKPWGMADVLQYSRVATRVGGQLSYNADDAGFIIGASYGTQLGGEEAATVKIYDVADTERSVNEIKGDGFGRDSMDCNAQLWTYLNQAKTSRIAALYSVRLFSKATSQVMGGSYTLDF